MVKGQWLAVLKQGRETAIALINNRTVKKIRAHSLNLLLIYNIKGFKSVKCCHTLSLESIKPYLVSTPKCPQGGSRDRIYINIHPEQWQRNTWSRKCPTLCFPNVPHFQKWKKMHFNAKLRGKKSKDSNVTQNQYKDRTNRLWNSYLSVLLVQFFQTLRVSLLADVGLIDHKVLPSSLLS